MGVETDMSLLEGEEGVATVFDSANGGGGASATL